MGIGIPNPIKAAKKVVSGGAKAVKKGVESGAKAVKGGVQAGAKATKTVARAGGKAAKAGGKVLKDGYEGGKKVAAAGTKLAKKVAPKAGRYLLNHNPIKTGLDNAKTFAKAGGQVLKGQKPTALGDLKANLGGIGPSVSLRQLKPAGQFALERFKRDNPLAIAKQNAQTLRNAGKQLADGRAPSALLDFRNPVGGFSARDGINVAKGVSEAVTAFPKAHQEARNADKNIRKLNSPGDSTKLSIDAGVDVSPGKAYGKGNVTVERVKNPKGGKDQFKVTLEGELGGGVAAQLGAKGPKGAGKGGFGASAEASATLGANGKVEAVFDNQEEVARAVKALVKPPGWNPLQNAKDHAARFEKGLKPFARNATAVEYGIKANASVEASLGIAQNGKAQGTSKEHGTKGVKGLFVNGSYGTAVTGRVEFLRGKPDQPTKLTLKGAATGQLSGQAGLSSSLTNGKTGPDEKTKGGGAKTNVGGQLQGGVEASYSIDAPKDFYRSAWSDPSKAFNELGNNFKNGTATVKVSGEARSSGRGYQRELEFKGKPEVFFRDNGTLDQIAAGNWRNAPGLTATSKNYRYTGVDASASISAQGYGGSFGVHSEHRDYQPPPSIRKRKPSSWNAQRPPHRDFSSQRAA